MNYTPIKKQFYIKNREKVLKKMENNSIAIILSNYEYPKNADLTYKFKQESNLFYLTGIEQEDTILILFKGAPKEELKEQLLIKETSSSIKIWNGDRLTKQEASNLSGIKEKYIKYSKNFEKILKEIMNLTNTVYLITNDHSRNKSQLKDKNHNFALKLKEQYPLHQYKKLTSIITKLRLIKQKEEINQIKKAIKITEKAFNKIKKIIKPGISEKEIEAEIIYEFIKNGAEESFESIIASGQNT